MTNRGVCAILFRMDAPVFVLAGSLSVYNAFAGLIEGELDMSGLVREMVNGEMYQYFPLGEYVVRAAGVCGGRPTFKYTRIEVAGTMDRLAAGESLDEVVAGYRGRVSREAVMEALRVVMNGFLQTLPELELA